MEAAPEPLALTEKNLGLASKDAERKANAEKFAAAVQDRDKKSLIHPSQAVTHSKTLYQTSVVRDVTGNKTTHIVIETPGSADDKKKSDSGPAEES